MRRDAYQRVPKGTRRRRKKKRRIFPLFSVAVLLVFAAVFTRFMLLGGFQKPLYKLLDGWSENGIHVVIKDQVVSTEYPPIINDQGISFPYDFIKAHIDDSIFLDGEAGVITVTNQQAVIRMGTDDLTYYVNSNPLSLQMPVYTIDGSYYMPASLIETLYHLQSTYLEEENVVVIDDSTEESKSAQVTARRTKVTLLAEDGSETLDRLEEGETVRVFETEGEYTKIRTAKGIPGYVPTEDLSQVTVTQPQQQTVQVKEPWKPEDGKIMMVWDQIFTLEGNNQQSKREAIDGLDVLSPTWFALADGDGTVSNIADASYVSWAHSQGYQVWALFSNSFDGEITHEALSSPDTRDHIIKQILAFSAIYNLDGINIDFENVNQEDGDYYIQFIRELTPMLREQGLTVSVDVYVPSAWTQHYHREELGETVDYVVVMVYDEHWSTSPESGSVASLNWSEEAVANTVSLIPKEKVIMGVPFFTRQWEETTDETGQTQVSSQAYGMTAAEEILAENQVEVQYDEATGQNYGQYEKDGSLYRIWLEDEQSMASRMEIAQNYDVAGISGWKRGLEKEQIWDVIRNAMKP